MKVASIIAAASFVLPAAYAQAASQLTMLSAPDNVSRSILAHQVTRFEDGASSKSDIAQAIHRNYPQIVEQNFARMDAAEMHAFLDNLSDAELRAIAQLYTNANADASRNGVLLLVAANRLDGVHLSRLSKFFGYGPVYDALLKAAPTKTQDFAQHTSIVYEAPKAGAATPLEEMYSRQAASRLAAEVPGTQKVGVLESMAGAFKPQVSMTLEEIYTGFRGMQVGSMASQAALYETGVYAGTQLSIAWGIGYGFGKGLTYIAQTYAPTWYYDSFVPAVGSSIDFFQNMVDVIGSAIGGSAYDLGHSESGFAPVMYIPSAAVSGFQSNGGDLGVAEGWAVYYVNSGTSCARGQKCAPPSMR